MDKISIIIPVYNVENYIRQCLDSIVNQTYSNLEIIIIDDGSPDNCGMICDDFAKKDDRVVVIHKKNAGVSSARNDGLRMATGKWIAFVDPDDWCELDYFEKLICAIRKKDVDIFCSGGGYWEYKNYSVLKKYTKRDFAISKEKLGEEWRKLRARVIAPSINIPYFFPYYPGVICWDKLYKADFIRRWKIQFDIMLHPWEDDLINYIMFDKAVRIAGCSYIGYHYRQTNPSSVTRRYQKNCVEIVCTYLEKLNSYKSFLTDNDIDSSAKNVRAIITFKYCLERYYFHAENPMKYASIAEEIREFKKNRYIQKAVWSKNNKYLPKRCLALKYVLRIPWVWPVWVFYRLNQLF